MHLAKSLLSTVLDAPLLPLRLQARAADEKPQTSSTVQHVLLISVDGLHALDLANYVNTHEGSNLAQLRIARIPYTRLSLSPREPNNKWGSGFPHQYLRVNTKLEVVKGEGGTTASIDKHPSYEWTNGRC